MAKKIFADKNDLGPIKILLKQILDIVPKEVTILNNELIDKPYKDRKFEVDLLVETDDGVTIGVEINTDVSSAITDRNLFYMCRVMSRDLNPNEDFKKLNKHIQISFDFKNKQELPIMNYKLINKETLKILSDKMEIIKINVPYFYNRCYNKDATVKERFIGLFNEEDMENALKLLRGDKDMEELYNKILENSNSEMVGLYNLESHRREVERSVREEAVNEAYNKGIIMIAKNMIKEKADIKFISKVTGLSIEKINELRNS